MNCTKRKFFFVRNPGYGIALAMLLFCCLLNQPVHSQKTDKKLQQIVQRELKGFHGTAGVYIMDLTSGKTASINADTIFPTASIVKIPIMLGVMEKIRQGELQYHQKMTYTDSLFYSEGEDMLASFKSGEQISVAKLLLLMLSTSDNTASLWLQGLSEGGERINKILDSLGYKSTRVNSRTAGRHDDWELYGWGQTTPKEIADILKKISDMKMFSPQLSDRMLRMLSRQFWDENGIAAIPPDVFVADKTGAVDASRNELMLVKGKKPYILSVFTKNNIDQRWDNDNEAWLLIQRISRALWHHFNPKSSYEPMPYLN